MWLLLDTHKFQYSQIHKKEHFFNNNKILPKKCTILLLRLFIVYQRIELNKIHKNQYFKSLKIILV